MSQKLYLSAQQLLEDSFRLGAKIIQHSFRPTIIIAIWRGGTPMGTAVQELLAYHGIDTDHIAIRTSSYSGIDGRSNNIRVHGMNYLVKNCRQEDSLLIVDDVFDTGHTINTYAIKLDSIPHTTFESPCPTTNQPVTRSTLPPIITCTKPSNG